MRIKGFYWLTCSLSLLLIACSEEPPATTETLIKPAKLAVVESASDRRELTFPAVVRAVDYAELTFQVPGEIRELNVLEGDDVEQGTVIAQLDQRDANNELARARAEFQNAEAEYQRAQRLIDQDAISISVLGTRKTTLDISRAALASAEKALSDTVLRAPFAGGISRVYARQFQNIQAKEAIAVIQSDNVEAIVNVPGTIIARIPQLEPVNTKVVLDAAPDTEILATFREATGVADENTQTYEISFTFTPPEELLILPGMTAEVITTFIFRDADDIVPEGVAAPLAAILAEGTQTYVWLVNTDTMTISKHPVMVQSGVGDQVIVVDGLQGGETIISAGVAFFHDGMRVSAWQPE